MKPFICFLLWGIVSIGAQDWKTVSSEDARIHYVGRTWNILEASTGEKCRVFSWPGIQASLRFEGTAVRARLRKNVPEYMIDSSWYKVFIDGQHTTDIAYKDHNTDTSILLAENLSPGIHTVSLYKRTETSQGTQIFCGFSFWGTDSVPPLPIPQRRLEFVGNSITCGYGVMDSCGVGATCPSFTTTGEDHYHTYAAIAARALGAEDQTICWSGMGLYRNYMAASGSDPTMPIMWKYAQPVLHFSDTVSAAAWDYSLYVPDAVVINLGTNDFSTGIPPQNEFVQTYVDFIHQIQAQYGSAIPILLLLGPMLSNTSPTANGSTMEKYLDETIAQTGSTVHKLVLTEMQPTILGVGADWHPNQAQSRLNAGELESKLRSILGWVGVGNDLAVERKTFSSFSLNYAGGVLSLQMKEAGSCVISMHDLQGKMLYRKQQIFSQGLHQISLPDHSFAQGVVVLRVVSGQFAESMMIFNSF